MPAHQFNNWRAINDVPALFECFETVLPLFMEWMASTGLTVAQLHRFAPLGDLFEGDVAKSYFRNPEPEIFGDIYQCVEDAQTLANRLRQVGRNIVIEGHLEPYFHWLRQRSDTHGYFCIDQVNSQYTNTFVYGGWAGAGTLISRALLFRDHPVLKLGGVKLPLHATFDARNLDFCDLDGLEIGEGWTGSRRKPINFSSCRQLLVNDANACFFDFYRCVVDDLVAKDSTLQDWNFTQCFASTMRFENCALSNVTFDRTLFTPIFERCQPRQIAYKPDSTGRHHIADSGTYRAIRALFQSVGKTAEAGRFFYLEQCAHRKALSEPHLQFPSEFPGLRVPSELYPPNAPRLGAKPVREPFVARWRRRMAFNLKAWLSPRYARTTLRFKLRWAASMIDWLIWGYGERPARIFSAGLMIVLVYAAVFFSISDQISFGEGGLNGPIDCLYFSMVTYSTLGYGDILPKTSLARLLCGSEALLGAFTMGLVVAGFSNRNRY
ncbi:potassium channel family protein [Burkholderia stagnalis]|uniref:potassium channel family protein n=1 Tax=Burkholderia stagnalis TaxID=1503054 RepID=UPI000F586BE0|nr:potassium channel family protein [Burkholderia stagnalis]RQQ45898.1 two pore domain potassium channel family protein [Burkholderia stagnalis]RQX95557.1 two pore domain potassium channel family protein [Burkholderia stagnalis]RQY18586.1 two pore domain potassium channel family protein [Burkholderia stagnalis]RQY27899.1 two pore domain potassium channel family protein [Burkholderia stagnalis]